MTDNRQSARRKTYLGGRLYYSRRQCSVDCLVKNMGEAGARLSFGTAAGVPDEFDLYLARLDRTLRARVVWRGGHDVGVAFLGRAA